MDEWNYQALGGLEVVGPTGRLDLGTRKQRAVLAVLLLEEGRPVSVDRLIDAVWDGAPPERAEASLHSYVSTLRRALEPDRAPRQPATVLVRRGNGYALVVPAEQVDFRRFARAVETARRAHTAGDVVAAGAALDDALASYAVLLPEFEGEAWCEPDRLRLARLHTAAVRLSYDVRLARGEHRLLEPELRAAAAADPLDEELSSMLALALYRSDRQGEALQTVATCKRALADRLGVDPGPRLRKLEADLLAQSPTLAAPPTVAPGSVAPGSVAPGSLGAGPGVGVPPGAPPVPAQRAEPAPTRSPSTSAPGTASDLVGRADELDALLAVVAQAADGRTGVGVVEAEAGAGKTRLLTETAARAEAAGARAVWGRCSQGAGAPALWPWVQIATSLVALHPQAAGSSDDVDLAPLTSGTNGTDAAADPGAQFRQSEALVRLVQQVSCDGPLLLVVDDLHWADEASLALLEHLAARLPSRVALLVGLRPPASQAPAELLRALGALARTPHQERLQLTPLTPQDVVSVVRQESGQVPDDATALAIHARTGGNAFFVRELVRLLLRTGGLDAGAAGVAGDVPDVPASVRDVVRSRLAALPALTADLLRLAAVAGRDIDLRVLASAAGLSVPQTHERLAPAVDDGVLVAHPQRASWWRFAHDLVRDAVISTTPPLRAPALHLQVADAFEAVHPEAGAEPLAHHLWSAGALADPARTARALLRAARVALGKQAHGAAQRHLELAAGVSRNAGLDELELDAITLLTSVASVRIGYARMDPAWFERGEALARRLQRQQDVGHLIYARWAAASQALRLDESAQHVAVLRELAAEHADPLLELFATHASGVDHWDRGEIGDAFRALERAAELLRSHGSEVSNDVMRFDLQVLSPAFRAVVTGMHGDLEASRAMLADIERRAAGDPYRTVAWAQFAAIMESMAGDAVRTMETCRRGLEADPDGAFPFMGNMILVEYWWAAAVLATQAGGPDAAADAAEACRELEQVVADIRRTGALTGEPGNLTLLADALLVSGRLDAAGAALDQAWASLEEHGQRADEPLVHLVRARLQLARGEAAETVRATIELARSVALTREVHLFVQQAESLLELVAGAGTQSSTAPAAPS